MHKLEHIEVYKFRFKLEKPFTISLGSVSEKEEIIVKIADTEGNIGWGEGSSSSRILASSPDSIVAALDEIGPLLIGGDPRRIARIVDLMDMCIDNNAAAKAAIDIAIHDLVGNIYSEPVWRMLGGYSAERVETDFTVGIGTPEEMVAEAKGLVDQGFKTIKVKVGQNPAQDVEKIRLLRETLGEKINLRIDANQGWTRQEAVWALERMAPYNIQFVEQPVSAHDIEGMAWVRFRSPISVMADESVHSPQDALRVIKEEAADYINIKLMKSGGLFRARKIAAIAEAACVPCMIGGMVESNLSATAAVHFALATKNVVFRDLDLGERKEAMLVVEGGSHIDRGEQVLYNENSPGLGIQKIREGWLGNSVRVYASSKGR